MLMGPSSRCSNTCSSPTSSTPALRFVDAGLLGPVLLCEDSFPPKLETLLGCSLSKLSDFGILMESKPAVLRKVFVRDNPLFTCFFLVFKKEEKFRLKNFVHQTQSSAPGALGGGAFWGKKHHKMTPCPTQPACGGVPARGGVVLRHGERREGGGAGDGRLPRRAGATLAHHRRAQRLGFRPRTGVAILPPSAKL